MLAQELADGHLIGNHTHTHAALTTLSAKQVVAEVERTDEMLEGLVPQNSLYFRPPFGSRWTRSASSRCIWSPMRWVRLNSFAISKLASGCGYRAAG